MVNYLKSRKGEYFVNGLTHNDTNQSQGVELAKEYRLFDVRTDGWLERVEVKDIDIDNQPIRHKGLGRSLVEGFEGECRSLGLMRVVCNISCEEEGNEFLSEAEYQALQVKLERWYESMGYVLVKRKTELEEIITFGIKVL